MKIFLEAFVDTNFGDNLFLNIVTKKYSQHEFYMLVKDDYKESYETLIKYVDNIHLIYNNENHAYLYDMDAMFIVGGDMFSDRFDYSLFLKQAYTIKKAGGFVAFLGCSLFKKYSLFTWIDLFALFSLADIMVVREKETYHQLKTKMPWVNIISMADMVFSTDIAKLQKEDVKAGVLGISVRKKNQVGAEPFYSQYCSGIAKIITQYLKQSKANTVHILALSVGKFNDAAVADDIVHLCSATDRNRIQCIAFDGDVHEYMKKIQQCDTLLCTRFHALVFAILLQKPFVPVIYEEKMNRLLNEIQYYGIRPQYESQLDMEKILDSFSSTSCDYDKLQSYIKKASHFFDDVDCCMEKWMNFQKKKSMRTLVNSMLYGVYFVKKYVLCKIYRKYVLPVLSKVKR